jgi:alanine racemase
LRYAAPTSRRLRSLSALRHNLRSPDSARRRRREVWAVVKAHAYGHGLERAARGFDAADGSRCSSSTGAARLRLARLAKPILMLEGVRAARRGAARRYGLAPVSPRRRAGRVAAQAPRPKPIDVYLKVNTGMNRLGVPPPTPRPAVRRCAALPRIRHVTLMTHFADADGPGGVPPSSSASSARDRALSGAALARELRRAARLPETRIGLGAPGHHAVRLRRPSPTAAPPRSACGRR